MDHQMKLKQLYHIDKLEKEQQLEFVNQIDVNCSIPDNIPGNTRQNWFLGYSPLHFAAYMLSLDLVSEFIRRGASTVKQEAKNQRTPLHLIIDHVNYHEKSIDISTERRNLANALLSAQIQSNIAINPKCNDGVSHFHIACLFNHTAAIEFFIKIGESIDQMTNIGLTSLHCAIKSSSFDAVKILLRHGADLNLKDAKGISSLILLTDLLIEANDLKTLGKYIRTGLYEDDIEEIESIFTLILELKINDSTFSNNLELTLVHMACMLKNTSILKNFFKKSIDFYRPLPRDSEFWPGWTPLHFAACCNVESFELLIKNGAKINVKSETGETPLDLLVMRYAPGIVQKILSRRNEFKNILFSDGLTKLSDVLQAMNNCEEFNNFLTSLPCVNINLLHDSVIWPGFSLLHLSIMMNEKTKEFDELSNLSKLHKINDDDQRYNCSKDEIALHMRKIKVCLERGCNVSMKNADGLTPIHLAFKMHKNSVVNELLSCCQDNIVDPHGLSHFHIACAAGNQNAVENLLSKGVDINRPTVCCFVGFKIDCYNLSIFNLLVKVTVTAQSSPLHIAVTFDNKKLTECLVENGADVFAEDARRLTPIHLSLRCELNLTKWLFKHALNNVGESKNVVAPGGFSYLFLAAAIGDDEGIEKLLRDGAQVDVSWPTGLDLLPDVEGLTPLHFAVFANSDKAVRALIEGGANIFAADPFCKHDTPLHRAFDKMDEKLFRYFSIELRRNETPMATLDSRGLTQLHLACGSFDLDWAEELLEKGADVNAAVKLECIDDEQYEADRKLTPLLLLIGKGSSREEGTPPDFMDLLQLIIRQGADVTIDCKNVTPLHYVCGKYITIGMPSKNNGDSDEDSYFDDGEPFPHLEVADLLLKSQKSYNTNPTSEDGFSHFHYACLRNDVEIVKKFLDNDPANVNQITSPSLKHYAGFSPLHFAFVYRSDKVIPLLIESGADVKAEDAYGNTPLHYAIIYNYIDFQLFDKMLSLGANINAKNVIAETPMILFLNRKDLTLENLQFFIDRGAMIDVTKSQPIAQIFDIAIRNSTTNDVLSVYKTLLKACVVEPTINRSFNVIHSIVAVYDENRKLDFYLDIIRQFLDLGFELNWQNERSHCNIRHDLDLESELNWLSKNGVTALHRASDNYVPAAVEALLILGADANIVDQKGEAPLRGEVYDLDYVSEYTWPHGLPHSRTRKTIKILVAHVWKMKLIQLDVINSFADAAASAVAVDDSVDIDESFKSTCQNELTKIENTTIGQAVPLRNFLSEWGAVIEYPMMPFAHRELVDEYFTDADGLRKEFPEFCGLLMLQYRKALDRVELLRSAKCVIVSECEIDLPDLCLEAIFIYFKNDDLKILIADSDEILHPCKRQKI